MGPGETRRHAEAARQATLHGRATPAAPIPISRLLGGFIQQLLDKSCAVIEQLRADEVARLAWMLPGLVAALEANDADVMRVVRDLLPAPPDVITLWLRAYADILERRFAS